MGRHWPASPGMHSGASSLQQAQVWLQHGQLAQAADACRAVLARHPAHADAAHLLGLVLKAQGDHAQALHHLQISIQLAPARADFHANLGNLWHLLNRHDEAIAAYRQALARQHDFRPAWLGLVRAQIAAGEHHIAMEDARRMLRIFPRDADAWVELARAADQVGQCEQAESSYRRALGYQPDHLLARQNLGAMLSRLGRADEALVEIERAVAAGARGPAVCVNLAITLAQLGRFEQAERSFEAALQDAPGYLDVHVRLAKLRFMQGQSDFARSLRGLADQYPAHPQVQLAYGSLLRDAGDLDAARQCFVMALHAGVNDPALLIGLALTEMEAGRFADAMAAARAAVEQREDYLHIATVLQSALLSLGRADEAWPLIQQARRAAPLHQEHIACEAVAARVLGLSRYQVLYDFDRFLQQFVLTPPSGYASMTDFNQALAAALAERQRLSRHPLDQSLRFGAQTSRSLLADPHPLIQSLLACFAEPIAAYRACLPKSAEHPLLSRNAQSARLSGCWSVRLHRQGHHLNHVHPSGWISAACYVQVPAEADDAQRCSGWIRFGEPRYPVPGVTAERVIQPRAGSLVMFPSYFWHGTVPLIDTAPRVTVGFDVVPV